MLKHVISFSFLYSQDFDENSVNIIYYYNYKQKFTANNLQSLLFFSFGDEQRFLFLNSRHIIIFYTLI